MINQLDVENEGKRRLNLSFYYSGYFHRYLICILASVLWKNALLSLFCSKDSEGQEFREILFKVIQLIKGKCFINSLLNMCS